MPERPADPLRGLARAALLEITAEDAVGADAGEREEGDGVVSYLFECRLPGYPGWRWTVSVATAVPAEGDAAGNPVSSVLEAELLPGDGALLAPDWVPWSVRLAEWKAAQAAAAESAGESVDGALEDDTPDGEALGEALDDVLDDEDEFDEDDLLDVEDALDLDVLDPDVLDPEDVLDPGDVDGDGVDAGDGS
ncbi:MAG: DUF3027 domain-containing protein [Microbacteriaceae bacterium]